MKSVNISAFAVREKSITLFLIIAFLVAGCFAYFNMGRSEDPQFAVKVMTVIAVWPGASSREMQEQVSDKLEKRLQELEFYDRVESTARPGIIAMKLVLQDSIPANRIQEQFYQARKKLGDKEKKLPSGVIGPILDDEFSDVYFTLYAFKSADLEHRELVQQAEIVRQKLLGVKGVEKTKIIGEQPQKVFVEISNQRLATLGIAPTSVFSALRNQNDLTSAGFVDTDGPRVHLRFNSSLSDIESIKAIPINVNDRILKLSDLASVYRGYEDPPSFKIFHNGEETLVLGVVMKPHFDGLSLGKSLEKIEAEITATLPIGISLHKFSNQAKIIDDAVNEFMIKFFTALAVVIIVSFISLGFRVGIVVAAAVPLTLSIVFLVMLVSGFGFDRITLGALIISLGLLVDDAIIAIEMMVVKMQEGLSRVKAATYIWSSTAAPMLTGTMVTILGFFPIGFAKSTAGEYAGNIFWIVGVSLIVSWFVAVFFTPYLGVKLLPNLTRVERGHNDIYNTVGFNRLRKIVTWSVDNKWKVVNTTIVLFAISVLGLANVNKQFFPDSNRPELTIQVTLPEGSTITATELVAKRIESAIRELDDAETVTTYVGQGAPRFFLSLNPELPNPAYAQIVVLTKGSEQRKRLKSKISKMVKNGIAPEARVRVTQFVFGPPVPYPVLFRVVGPNINVLRDISQDVLSIMQQNPNLISPHFDWSNKTLNLPITFDQERLRLIGLTPNDAAQQLQVYLNGYRATQVRESFRLTDVVVRSPEAERLSLGSIGDFVLTTKNGLTVPLSQVANLVPATEDPVLKRYDREPYIAVQADVIEGVQPPEASKQVSQQLSQLIAQLPQGYRIDTGGSVEESNKANIALAKLFPIMLILTLTFIIFQVRTFSAMLMVIATAPLGLIGAVPTMLMFNQPFGFNAILALIGLAGILMRNTLILIDYIAYQKKSGSNDYHSIIESTVHRARPVVLTAVAAMLAFIPLTYSSFWGSLAFVLIGGVGVGTFLTLFFLPALYAAWFKISKNNISLTLRQN